MGNEGEGSKRAWAWFFRCCDVQARGGEVVLATATPASNSPLELYNLVKLIDKDAWNRIGIYDPEAFIDRFCLLEQQEVLNAEMEAVTSLACVGFKNLDELRSVIFKFWEFKTAKQAGLKLPEVKVERVSVPMDADQEAKYVDYLKQIEEELGKHRSPGARATRSSGCSRGWRWSPCTPSSTRGSTGRPRSGSPRRTARSSTSWRRRSSPSAAAVTSSSPTTSRRTRGSATCSSRPASPPSKIGILNAVVAPNAADRLRIARDFNAGKYDVLIANAIGEEGLDLQDRTCAIHHLDIGWTPKKTEQRNGRGVRQGNSLKNINIYYYISERSQDGARLDMVRGKQNWISSLIEGEAKDTNNPAAQSTLSREELLVLISRDPEKTAEAFAKVKAQREEERKAKIAKAATDTLRAVADRFSRARTEKDPTTAAEYRSTAKQKLDGLTKVPTDIWPWAAWASAAVSAPMLVPKAGAPVYEGLRVAMPSVVDREVIQYVEFGRIDGANIAIRVAGAAHWEVLEPDKLQQLHLEPGMRITEASTARWPGDDQASIDRAMQAKWLPRLRHGAGASQAWRDLGWHRAPDVFVAAQWERWGTEIVGAMASTGGWAQNLQVPAVRRGILDHRPHPAVRGRHPADAGRVAALPRAGAARGREVHPAGDARP